MSEMFDDLMKGFDEIQDDIKSHGQKLKRNKVLYVPVKKYTSKEVKKIRENVGMTQKTFAEYLGVSNKTVEAWEAGLNVPAGSSSRILSMMEMDSKLPEKYPFVSTGK